MDTSRCGFLFIFGLMMMRMMHTKASNAIFKRIDLHENQPTGTIVAELSDLLDTRITPGLKKNFQLLSQKLTTRKRNTSNQHHQWFLLDEDSGTVSLQQSIDREEICGNWEQCTINVQIFVKRRSRLIELNVEILNVNEHPPVFPVSFILVNISEGAKVGDNINLDKYKASDMDTGNNSSITYSLNPNDHFKLRQYKDETGTSHLLVEVRKGLDYESKSFYSLSLFANDNGKPTARTSHVPLQIKVTDENDNIPVFDQKEYSVSYEESLETGQVIASVQAHDADSGLAGTVRYHIAGANKHITSSLVTINKISGQITLLEPLDRESFDELKIFIEARDQGKPRRIGRTRLVVYISDVNDNAPIVSISYIEHSEGNTVYIPESTSKANFFAYVSAMDSDQGRNGKVSLMLKSSLPYGKGSDGIQVDSSGAFRLYKNGFIGINKNLDAETQNRYKIIITATDEGFKPKSTSKDINVVVLDVNDNPPMFSAPLYNVSVSESTRVGSDIATIKATDMDASNPSALQINELEDIVPSTNGDVTYSILGDSSSFSVEPKTGVVSIVTPLDREQRSSWMVSVAATDGGNPSLSSQSHLFVRVVDTNDNAPVFDTPGRDGARVYATILRDHLILKILAIDYDEGNNGKVHYKLISEDGIKQTSYVNTSLFMLDSKSGELRLNRSHPDLSKSLGQHVIVVQALDSGLSPMKTQRTINIVVTDKTEVPDGDLLQSHSGAIEPHLLYIVIASVVATVLVLVVVIIVIILKCKKRNKRKEIPDRPSPAITDLYSTDVRMSTNVKTSSQDGSIAKENKVWHQSSTNKFYNSLTTGSATTDVTNLSRSDIMMTHQFLTLPKMCSVTSPSQTGSLDGRKLSPATLAVPSGGRPQCGDSGRGDSDPDVISADTPFEQEYQQLSAAQERSSANESFHENNLGQNCSPHCLHYGHSDACWMPQASSQPVFPNLPPMSAERRFTPSPSSEAPSLPPSRTDCSDQSSNLEAIPESKAVRVYWPQAYNGSSLTSIYSKLIPPVYLDPDAIERRLETEERHLLKDGSHRIGSSADSTTTGYVTEPEVV